MLLFLSLVPLHFCLFFLSNNCEYENKNKEAITLSPNFLIFWNFCSVVDFCVFTLYMWINKAAIAVRSSIMGVYCEQNHKKKKRNGNRVCQVVNSVHN